MITVITDKLILDNKSDQVSEAMELTEQFIEKFGLKGKKAIHLRLLVEETLGMAKAMMNDYQAMIHIEGDDKGCRICLTAKTIMDAAKKSGLLGVSSSGKNAAVKGFMSKLGDIIENGILNYDEVMRMQQEYGGTSPDLFGLGMGASPGMDSACIWTLESYRDSLEGKRDETEVSEAWDELEKSIVASIAKNVTVGIKKDRVDMVIELDI